MPIKFSCHKCSSVLKVAEQHIGKQAKCPKCGEKCVVPAESQAEPAAAAGSPLPAPAPPAAAPPSGFPSFGEPAAAPAAAPNFSTGAGAVAGAAGLPAFGGGESPYSAPMPSAGGKLSNTVMHPLYQVRGMMQWFGWTMFIIGIIYCITIIGAIIGWLPIWMGSLINGASKAVKIGVERGDENQLRLANQKIATFFKICGVLAIIYAVLIALYFCFILVMVILAVVNGGV